MPGIMSLRHKQSVIIVDNDNDIIILDDNDDDLEIIGHGKPRRFRLIQREKPFFSSLSTCKRACLYF
jgi:hypothetical protein